MRATRAEVRGAGRNINGLRESPLKFLKGAHFARELFVGAEPEQAFAQGNGNVVGIQRPLYRKQPIALFVFLADTDRLIAGAVKFLANLHLNERALLLDHYDEVETAGKFHEVGRIEWPRTSDLIKPQAKFVA